MNNYDNLDVNIYKIKTVRSYAEHLKILLEAELDDVTINIREVYKNNDSHLTGLIFIEKNNTLSPTLYVNDCFEGYKHGIPLKASAAYLKAVYLSTRGTKFLETDMIYDFDKCKSNIFYKLVNRKANANQLKEMPYIPFLDLAIIFNINIKDCNDNNASIKISNELMKVWNIQDVNHLYQYAQRNTETIFGYAEIKLTDLIDQLSENYDLSDEIDISDCDDTDMIVITNKYKNYGASCILYNNILRHLYDIMDGEYYLLPSSIHEFIAIPYTDDTDGKYIQEMLQSVNHDCLRYEEILSNNIYYYNSITNQLEIFKD